jgi:hypothetical protein
MSLINKYNKYKYKYEQLGGKLYVNSCISKYTTLLLEIGKITEATYNISTIFDIFNLTKCNKEFYYNNIPEMQKIIKQINSLDTCYRITKKSNMYYIY